MARLAITSLAFMFDWVPEPVCHTESGKWSSRRPSSTSRAARTMSAAFSADSRPASAFSSAQTRFRRPKACTTSAGIRSWPMAKWCSERSVWAPQ